MALIDDLRTESNEIVKNTWDIRDSKAVPEPEDLGLKNEGVRMQATFLYADLADSTELAIGGAKIAAEVFKAYLRRTTRIIRALGGEIRSFDGDRVMGVFTEGNKNTAAAKAALKINHFFRKILHPAFAEKYRSNTPGLVQTVGIDTSNVLVVRAGIRNNNDLVWVGRAPNVAAKLSAIRDGNPSYITEAVFNSMLDEAKYGVSNGVKTLMWVRCTWKGGEAYGVPIVYRSTWTWQP